MDTMMIAQPVAIVNVVKSPYWVGFDAYMDGKKLDEMLTDGERRGWRSACAAEGEAMIDGCIEQDHDWIRGGC